MALPNKLLGELPLLEHRTQEDMLAGTQQAFKDFIDTNNSPMLVRLLRALGSHGPALGGPSFVLQALLNGKAEHLVMAHDYRPKPIRPEWMNEQLTQSLSSFQNASSGSSLLSVDMRVELLRLASQQGVPVQLTNSSELEYLGGVACLLKPESEAAEKPVETDLFKLVA